MNVADLARRIRRLRRSFVVALALTTVGLSAFAGQAAASDQPAITIETSKAFGPVPGTFSVHGALTDHGSMVVLSRTVSGIGAPTFLVSHLTILFAGSRGSITIKTQIVETFTADPLVLTNAGSWAIVAGTGEYAALCAEGSVQGLADEHIDVITRTYEGTVHAG